MACPSGPAERPCAYRERPRADRVNRDGETPFTPGWGLRVVLAQLLHERGPVEPEHRRRFGAVAAGLLQRPLDQLALERFERGSQIEGRVTELAAQRVWARLGGAAREPRLGVRQRDVGGGQQRL